MSKIRKPSILIPMPKAFVRSALSLRGSIGTRASLTPYWSHAILEFVLEKFHLRGLWTRISHSHNADIRVRALKKKAREAKAQ